MAAGSQIIDRKLLKTLNPLSGLNSSILDEIAAKSSIEKIPSGTTLFREGDRDNRYIYVLNGSIALSSTHGKKEVIKAKSAAAESPLAHAFPRPVSAKAKSAASILVIDADLLEFLMNDNESPASAIEVTEISSDDSDAWMLEFMQSPAFLKLPTDNLQQLLMSMEEIHAKKGDVIIRQGARDDYYYILKGGRATVSRKPKPDAKEITLAILEEGAGFGEEALITDTPRNASIIMRDDGSLIRLQKNLFLRLMVEPLLSTLNSEQVKTHINQGSLLIDVRSPTIARQHPVTGAVNIPMSMLRLKFDTLKPGRDYLLICEDGNQSKAAAFLMIRQGLNCHIVKDGIRNSGLSVANLESTPAAVRPVQNYSSSDKDKLAAQQKQAAAARQKAEQEITRRKAELKAAQQQASRKAEADAAKMKIQAEQELARAQAEAEANRRREAELQQAAMQAETLMKQTQEISSKAREQAEQEAAAIRARALKDAERLRAEVEEARRQLSIESARAKQHEADAIRVRQEAEAIKEAALSEVATIKAEIQSTREELQKKLARVEADEARQRASVLASARKRAEEVARAKTRQAEQEAESIKRSALEEAQRLQQELQKTRQQIEAEASRAIAQLKQQASVAEQVKQAQEEHIPEIVDVVEEMEAVQDEMPLLAESTPDLSGIHIPLGETNASLLMDDQEEARQKAESIKKKLHQADNERFTNTFSEYTNPGGLPADGQVRVTRHKNKIVLEGDEDIFIFRKPSRSAAAVQQNSTSSTDRVQEQSSREVAAEKPVANPFLVDNTPVPGKSAGIAARDSDFVGAGSSRGNNVSALKKKQPARRPSQVRRKSGGGRWAIAAMLLLAIGGSITALHLLEIINVQATIAKLMGEEDKTAVADKKRKKNEVMRASKDKGKENGQSPFDSIMKGWQDTLSEMENPKKR